MTEIQKVIVIGGAPAGYTAAIYLARATLKPLVLAGEAAGGQLMWTTEVENYPGFPDGIMGPELMDRMKKQAEKFGANIANVNVTKVDFSNKIKKVWVGETVYEAEAVIVATGAEAMMLGLGEEKLLGRGVSTCAVCDAAFFRGKKVAVVGGGDAAIEDVLALTRFSDEVYMIHRRDSLRASKIMQERVLNNPKVKIIWNSQVIEVLGAEKLEKVSLKNNDGTQSQLELDGLFLAIGHAPTTHFLNGALELDAKGYLKTTQSLSSVYPTQTNVEGVFGAGDVVDFKYRQAITAAAMGCQAALDVERYLEK